MARIQEFKKIALDDLVIGKGQVRVTQVGEGIAELAESIQKIGQLEPIVVCPAEHAGKFEILTGQRRFLAHRLAKLPTIWAAILDARVDEVEAKVISVTENVVRKDLNRKDLIDACTFLYNKYGSVPMVAEATGLSQNVVREYVKFDQLSPELKSLVNDSKVPLKAALRAQLAAEQRGGDAKEAVRLAKEFGGLTGAQQTVLAKKLGEKGTQPLDEAIEEAKSGAMVRQIVVTLGTSLHESLTRFAGDEGTSVDDAAQSLIGEALLDKGY